MTRMCIPGPRVTRSVQVVQRGDVGAGPGAGRARAEAGVHDRAAGHGRGRRAGDVDGAHGGGALVGGGAAAADGAVVVVRVTEADAVAELVGDDVLVHAHAVAVQAGAEVDGAVGQAARGEAGGAAGAGRGLRGDGRGAAGAAALEGEAQATGVVVGDGRIQARAQVGVAVERGGGDDADLRHAG